MPPAHPDDLALLDSVGRRIAELRVKAGLTQEELAEILGNSLQYLQRLEAGRNLTLLTLARVARALDASVRDLLRTPRRKRSGPGRPRTRR